MSKRDIIIQKTNKANCVFIETTPNNYIGLKVSDADFEKLADTGITNITK